MHYDEFKALVRQAAEARQGRGALVPIPELRAGLAVEDHVFHGHVMRLQQDGLAHLLTHVAPDSLSPEVRRHCVPHPTGILLYWIRWL